MEIKKVGVVGCGLMGSGITQVSAAAGYETVTGEITDELIEKGLAKIDSFLSKSIEKGRITEQKKREIMGRIEGTTDLQKFKDCDIIIEAIIEDLDEKIALFRELDQICPPETIFASNTSSLTITQLGSSTKRPHKMVGLHFFNPVPIMKLVEVVRTILTDKDTFETAYNFSKSLGKEP
ncbi:MAG: 3-hydroxyacyl-CoA dehydrogenase family protein, partial [Fidelibacterota bacterium]